MTRPTRKKKGRKNLIFRICIFAFVAYAAVLLIDMQISLAGRKRQHNELRDRVEIQRIANKELERQLTQDMNSEYVERIARERLDFLAPDEKVYIDISGQ